MSSDVEPFRAHLLEGDVFVERAGDYGGEENVILAPWPSTIGDPQYTRRERIQIFEEWVELLARPTPIKSMTLWCRVNDALMRALAQQTQIENLTIHWGPYEDLTPIGRMLGLRQLVLGGASRLTDLSPLAALPALTHLNVENGRKLRDYSPIGAISSLRVLSVGRSISGGRTDADSLEFIRSLPQLDALYWDPRVASLDYSPLLVLKSATEIGITPLKGMTPAFVDLEWALPGVQACERRRSGHVIPLYVDGESAGTLQRDITGRLHVAPPTTESDA